MNFAAIEIGSNAVRMIVAELMDSCELRVIERWSSHLRLGDSVFEHGEIDDDNFQQLLETIQGLLLELKSFSQIKISISATSALREAKNRTEVVSRLKAVIGFPVKILSGIEESQCLLDGVKSFLPKSLLTKFPGKQTILADLGGGSLEISLLEPGEDTNNNRNNFLHSYNIGTLRLRKMENVIQQLKIILPDELSLLAQHLSDNPASQTHLILTGGNAKTFARLLPQVSNKYLFDKDNFSQTLNWTSIEWKEFLRIEQIFQKQAPDDQQKLWNLRPQQTDIFNIALAVFKEIGLELKAEYLSIPLFGLKESLLLNLVSAIIKTPLEDITLVLTSGTPTKFKISR